MCSSDLSAKTSARGVDWPMFGFVPTRSNAGPASTGIAAKNVSHLRHQRVRLDGTVDSSAIYLHDVAVHGASHDTLFVTTTYGRTEAIDASSGKVLWRFTPPGYSSFVGGPQITNATPVASTDRTAIYAAAPDGRIRKLRVSDGKVLWTTAVTRDPTHEKLTSSLNVSRGLVLVSMPAPRKEAGGTIKPAPLAVGEAVLQFSTLP